MRRTGWHVHAYVGGMAALTAYALDEWLDLRKWRRVNHAVPLHDSERLVVGLRARTRPPPIGAMDWPGGRTLLQWVLDVEELDVVLAPRVRLVGVEEHGDRAVELRHARDRAQQPAVPDHSLRYILWVNVHDQPEVRDISTAEASTRHHSA